MQEQKLKSVGLFTDKSYWALAGYTNKDESFYIIYAHFRSVKKNHKNLECSITQGVCEHGCSVAKLFPNR